MIYVTTLLDAKKYPKTAIASFYQQRWHIELDNKGHKNPYGHGVIKMQNTGNG